MAGADVYDTLLHAVAKRAARRARLFTLSLSIPILRTPPMRFNFRNLFPYLVIVCGLSAMAYAVTFGQMEKADFTFNNGTEVKTVDPAKAEGEPEGRVLESIFEGLLHMTPADQPPDEFGIVPLVATPATADRYTVSDDGKTYTFHIRDSAKWSNGDPVTAGDFVFSWKRYMHPETASQYAFQLHYVVGAKEYNLAEVKIGDRVEVELYDRPGVHSDPRGDAPPDTLNQIQPFPRGTILRGVLTDIVKPPKPVVAEGMPKKDVTRIEGAWQAKWVYVVDIKPEKDGPEKDGDVDWDAVGETRAFAQVPAPDEVDVAGEITRCHNVLIDWDSEVGVRAEDDDTLVITLRNPTPYFKDLVAFYTLYPVNPTCVETWGSPDWTKPEHIVTNGPFLLSSRRIRDRIRMKKNPQYWNADEIHLDVVDALTVDSETTDLNLFINGQIDWGTTLPGSVIPDLFERNKEQVAAGEPPDFRSAPMLAIYFYRINVTRPPFNDRELVKWDDDGVQRETERGVLIRMALNAAINKATICERVTRAGETPARHVVPPGLPGYESPLCDGFDPVRAKKLLAVAGFPAGRGMPKFQIIYNTQEAHRAIAEVIQQEWKTNLGIDTELRNLEWGVYQDRTTQLDYDVSRAGWLPDYTDANTFLDMWVTDGPQNNTGWSNAEYDRLIEAAAAEPDADERLKILASAEEVLLAELPLIPLYHYRSKNTVSNRVRGFTNNIRDQHPIYILRVEDE